MSQIAESSGRAIPSEWLTGQTERRWGESSAGREMVVTAGNETGEAGTPVGVAAGDSGGRVHARSSVSGGGWSGSWAFLSIILGVGIAAINIALAIKIWKYIFAKGLSGSLLFSLILLSFFIGLILIAFGITVGRSSSSNRQGDSGGYLTSLGVPLLLGAVAFAFTVWAGSVAEPDRIAPQTPRPCIDLFQQAVTIHQASPDLRLPANDADQKRCDINYFLRSALK